MDRGIADITGVRAKLGRAQVHLDALNDELLRLGKEYSETSFVNFSRDGEWHVVSAGPIPELPTDWSLIAGDFFNNLRATLDHLVWQLILREGNKPQQTNDFPIIMSESQFMKIVKTPPKKTKKRSPLYGLPVDGDAWTIIERAQPWYRGKAHGYEPRMDILATLALMSNIDKHRTLLASMALPDQGLFEDIFRWVPSDVQPIDKRIAIWEPLSHERPTELMRIRFAPDTQVTMYMNGRLSIGPTFGDENTQIAGFGTIHLRVSQIVDEIATLPNVQG